MRVNSFMINPDEVDPHTNHYAEGTVSQQTFSERKEIEKERKVISAYRYSQIGANFVTKGEYTRKQIRVPGRSRTGTKHSRQEMNASGGLLPDAPERSAPSSRQQANAEGGSMTFREPPSRGYNPYA